MINLTRRKRQAQENTGPLILAIVHNIENDVSLYQKEAKISNINELDRLIREIEPDVVKLAQSLHPDWALPIVLQAIGELYYGEYTNYNFCGNYFKRAAAYLWQNSLVPHGDYKNMVRLEELISRCYVLETLYSFRKMFIAIPDLWLSFENGHVNVPETFRERFRDYAPLAAGKGKRFRIAKENSRLMNQQSRQFLCGLKSVLDGDAPGEVEIFKNTFYKGIPGIENAECAKFWKEVFCRYCFYLAALTQCIDGDPPTSVTLFQEFAILGSEKYITQEIVTNSFWTKAWFNKQIPERYGSLLLDKPIVRISPNGDFATSPVLIGDSLNQFVEKQLLKYSTRSPYLCMPDSIFKDVFSEEFEDQCIDLFRNRGYLAGHVLETGVWKCQSGNVDLNFSDEKLYGEIDVLACHPRLPITFLIECKVLLDIEDSRSYQNLVAKLRDDSEGFKDKMRKKAVWLKESFEFRFGMPIDPFMFLVTDIPMPVIGVEDQEIILTYFNDLEQTLDEVEEKLPELSKQLLDEAGASWRGLIDFLQKGRHVT